MGLPIDRGRVEDGILTCHWHHARFDLASGCTFDLWANDVPTCAVVLRADEVWVQPEFGRSDAAAYWRQRLEQGMAHNLGLVIAKAIQGQLTAGVSPIEVARQAALFGARNRDGWGTGMTILTAVGNGLAILPEQKLYLALFHGIRRVAIDCDGEAPARQSSALASRPQSCRAEALAPALGRCPPSRGSRAHGPSTIAIGAPPPNFPICVYSLSLQMRGLCRFNSPKNGVLHFTSMDYIRCSARITITPRTAIITKTTGS